MEMFEWREKISDATSIEEKKKLIQSIEDIIVDVQKSFEQALQKRDAVSGMELAVRLNYYHKVCLFSLHRSSSQLILFFDRCWRNSIISQLSLSFVSV